MVGRSRPSFTLCCSSNRCTRRNDATCQACQSITRQVNPSRKRASAVHASLLSLLTMVGIWGDAAVQDSMISNLRLRMPDVQFLGVTLNGDNFVRQHGATVTFPLLASGLVIPQRVPGEFPPQSGAVSHPGAASEPPVRKTRESCPLGAREHSGTGAVFEKNADERDRGRPRDRSFLRRLPDSADAGCSADFWWRPTWTKSMEDRGGYPSRSSNGPCSRDWHESLARWPVLAPAKSPRRLRVGWWR